jgi:hypothetical protein
MKRLNAIVLTGCLASMLAGAAEPEAAPAAAVKTRVGTYDSRAVAVAFCGSEAFNQRLAEQKKAKDQAEAAGDRQKIEALRAEAAAGQQLLHKQGFSTAPVDDILERIKDRLPGIQERAGVSALVSKWDKPGLARYPDAEFVDVTMALVDAFNPNPRQRKSAVEIQKHDPIPLEKAARIRD